MKFIYNDGGRKAAGYVGDAGDCVTRSIAIITGRPYQEIYDAIAEGCRTQPGKKKASGRNGVNVKRTWFKRYMASLGFVWTATMGIGTGCKVHLRDGELPMGKLIISVSKHYTAVIDGVINDTFSPERDTGRCVYGYWRLVK